MGAGMASVGMASAGPAGRFAPEPQAPTLLWHLALGGVSQGPFGMQALAEKAAAGVLTIIPGAIVIYFVRRYIAKGFALGRV